MRGKFRRWLAELRRPFEPAEASEAEGWSVANRISIFEGDINSRTGSLLASWFVFNPNGPTAYAFGYMEEGEHLRFFCRWMHCSGGEIFVSDKVSARDGTVANFGKLSMDALIRLSSYIPTSGGAPSGPGIHPLPCFVQTNGNADIDKCLKRLVSCGSALSIDWGSELYYLKKYGTDLFGRAGEETRETYEQLLRESETDARIDKDFLKFIWYRHAHLESFRNWRPNAHQSQPFSEVAFDGWWSVISSASFVHQALSCFAHAWVGSIQVHEGSKFLRTAREEGRFIPFEDLVRFFDQFHLPLFRPDHASESA